MPDDERDEARSLAEVFRLNQEVGRRQRELAQAKDQLKDAKELLDDAQDALTHYLWDLGNTYPLFDAPAHPRPVIEVGCDTAPDAIDRTPIRGETNDMIAAAMDEAVTRKGTKTDARTSEVTGRPRGVPGDEFGLAGDRREVRPDADGATDHPQRRDSDGAEILPTGGATPGRPEPTGGRRVTSAADPFDAGPDGQVTCSYEDDESDSEPPARPKRKRAAKAEVRP